MRMSATKIMKAAKALKTNPVTAAAATVLSSKGTQPGATALERSEPTAAKPAKPKTP